MSADRDYWSHLENLEELREIIHIRGWGYTIGYLQALEEQTFPDPEMEQALEVIHKVARRADSRLSGEDPDAPTETPPSANPRKGRKPRRNP